MLGIVFPDFCEQQDFTADSGTFSSPDDPDNPGAYPLQANCVYTIEVPEEMNIELSFTEFATEINFDYVRIYLTNTADPIV